MFLKITAGPGFSIDEPVDDLGSMLKLPVQFEVERKYIETELPVIILNFENFK